LFVAAESGLLANLVGQGEIDDDEAQTVIAELKSLIDRHGGDALAEGFIRTP
jgi:polyhydroxyalkanoate synthesis regulator phasin